MAAHKFKLGDLVELARTSRLHAAPGPFEIVRLLPAIDDGPQYRIRGKGERHERMVNESDLERHKGWPFSPHRWSALVSFVPGLTLGQQFRQSALAGFLGLLGGSE
jgi:hypothetical protein